ncbi:hypothetical protein V1289_002912 [Bradyrhizobium sp. AZCC 2289]
MHCRARRRIGSRHLCSTTSSEQLHRRSMTATLAHSLIIGSSPFYLAECLPSSTRGNPRQVRSKRNKYPQAFVAFTAVKLNLWLVRYSPNLAAISPGRQPIPGKLLNKKNLNGINKKEIEKLGTGSEFPRSTRRTNPLPDGQPPEPRVHNSSVGRKNLLATRSKLEPRGSELSAKYVGPGFPTAL